MTHIPKTNHCKLIAGLLLSLIPFVGLSGEDLLAWDTFAIEGGIPGPTTLDSASSATGVGVSTLSLGPGITPRESNDSSRFQGENFYSSSLVEALDTGDYFEFTVTPEDGQAIQVENLTLVLRNRGGSTPARNIAIVSSQDGYLSPVAGFQFPGGNSGDTSQPVTLGVPGLFPITVPTTLRIVAYFPDGIDDGRTHPLTIGWASDNELTTTPALLLSGTVSALGGEDLLAWDTFAIEGGIPGPTTLDSASSATGVGVSTLSLGPGITPRESNDSSRFQGENFYSSSLVEAVDTGDYFEFTVTPEDGQAIHVENLTLVLRNRGGSTPARNIAIVSSQDGYLSPVAGFQFPGGNSGDTAQPVTLGVSGLFPITVPTTLRIVAYFPDGIDDGRTHPLTIGWPSDNELTTTPALLLSGTVSALGGEDLLAWDTFAIEGGIPGPTTLDSASSATGVGVSTLSLGPGITPRESNDSSRFQGENFYSSSVGEAVETGDYFEFTVVPEAGASISLNSLILVLRNRGGSTPARNIAIVSSQDGYLSPVAGFQFPGGNSGDTSQPVTLGISGLDPITSSTTFRIVAYFPGGIDDNRTHPLTIGWASDNELTTTPALLLKGSIDRPLPWDGLTSGDRSVSPWFGAFEVSDNGWLRHVELGWLYSGFAEDPGGFWMYGLYRESWLWSSDEIFPILYDSESGGYIYYFILVDSGVFIFDYTTGVWTFNP